MMKAVSFIMPAYNEQENIASVIEACRRVGKKISRRFEIVVVDDGSTDGTGEIVEALATQDPRVVPVHHTANRGIAKATRAGFETARYDHIVYTDADGQIDISEIESFIPYGADYDFVVGYRLRRADRFYRRIGSSLYNFLLRKLYGLSLHDANCALKLIRRESLQKLHPKSNSSFYLAEMLICAARRGMRIRQLPVHHYPRRHGSACEASLRIILPELWDLVRYRFIYWMRP